MFKDTQSNCANFCTEIIDNTDLKDLKKSFVEILTHDLKTPILAQIRVLDMIVDGKFGQLSNEQSEMLNLTLESCNYMYTMVATLISTYKFDIEEPELNYSHFNIIQIIENTIKKTELFLKENNIKIVIIPEIKNPIISGDLIRLTKVIQTLLFNSLNTAFKNSIIKIYLEEHIDPGKGWGNQGLSDCGKRLLDGHFPAQLPVRAEAPEFRRHAPVLASQV